MKNPITFLRGTIFVIITFMILLVLYILFSNKNTYGLVEKDYYQKAIKYQEQIDNERSANQLEEKVMINLVNSDVRIQFPSVFTPSKIEGEIVFFRPSDLKLDFTIQIDVEENGAQLVRTSNIQKGAWIVQIYWRFQDKKYYSEKRIFLKD